MGKKNELTLVMVASNKVPKTVTTLGKSFEPVSSVTYGVRWYHRFLWWLNPKTRSISIWRHDFVADQPLSIDFGSPELDVKYTISKQPK